MIKEMNVNMNSSKRMWYNARRHRPVTPSKEWLWYKFVVQSSDYESFRKVNPPEFLVDVGVNDDAGAIEEIAGFSVALLLEVADDEDDAWTVLEG